MWLLGCLSGWEFCGSIPGELLAGWGFLLYVRCDIKFLGGPGDKDKPGDGDVKMVMIICVSEYKRQVYAFAMDGMGGMGWDGMGGIV